MSPEAITPQETAPELRFESREAAVEHFRGERAGILSGHVERIFDWENAKQSISELYSKEGLAWEMKNFRETYPHKLEKATGFLRSVMPGSDMETFLETADESTGLKKIRYTAAAAVSALYWQFASQGKINLTESLIATGVLGALRASKLDAAIDPKMSRFTEAAAELLAGGKEYLQAAYDNLRSYVAHKEADDAQSIEAA